MAAMAAVTADVSAQTTPPVPVTQNPVPDSHSPSGGVLKAECGLRVMLVLDESASINAADVTRTRQAADAFVGALKDTGSELAITSFAVGARELTNGYNEVTDANLPGFNAAIARFAVNVTPSRNGTNWDDAFRLVRTLNATNLAKLVVFMTDGNPNTTGTPPNNTPPNESTAGWTAATPLSITAANSVKDQGSRIFAMGVGAAVSDTASQQRLKWISGDSEFGTGAGQNPDFATSDWTRVTDFTALRTALTRIVASLCGSRLIITKKVLNYLGQTVNASGWRFTASVDSPGHTWLHPDRADDGTTTGREATLTTDNDGIAEFQWRLHTATTATVGVTHEVEKDGYHFVSAQCAVHRADGTTEQLPINTQEVPGSTLARLEWQTCEVLNREPAAELTVVKHLEPSDDTGTFNLEINGQVERADAGNEDATPTLTLPLGPHTISETAGTGTGLADYDTSIQCVDLADDQVVAENTGETSLGVNLTRDGQHVVCTITNESTKFGQVTVIKSLIPADDPGRFNLLVNGSPPNAGSESVGDGGTTGSIRLPFGTVDVSESAVAPTDLADYDTMTVCTNEDNGGGTVVENTTGPPVSFELSRTDNNVVCIIENRRAAVPVAHLTVIKRLAPSGDAGVFDLLIGGTVWAPAVSDGGSTGRLEFELGKHTVTEQGADGTNLADFSISTTCVDKGHGGHTVAHNPDGPTVSVDLSSESDDIVCTITNTRTAAPPGPDETPDTPGPYLSVVKAMPAHARVGDEVQFTITVHNLGQGTANGVQVHETPPHGTQIVSVASHGTIQPDGTAVWHLGNLAPGASRTVHGTLRVTQSGSHVNTALATALNADPAVSVATLGARAPAPAPPPPVVTG